MLILICLLVWKCYLGNVMLVASSLRAFLYRVCRRAPPLQPYKLRCEREPLSGRWVIQLPNLILFRLSWRWIVDAIFFRFISHSTSCLVYLQDHPIVPVFLRHLTRASNFFCSLGAPDFYPPAPNCAEEILNRDTCQSGYKELIDGVEVSYFDKLLLR